MRTNNVVLESKANALRKVKRERALNLKAKRLSFSIKVSLFLNFIMILSMDAIGFQSMNMFFKVGSLVLLFASVGFTLTLINEKSKLSDR